MVRAEEGFDFLGMTFRYAKTSGAATKLRFNCYRWPRRKAVQSLKEKIRHKLGRRYHLSLQEAIREINPILRGWHNYFRIGQGEKVFRRLDRFVMNRLRIFVKRKHNNPQRGITERLRAICLIGWVCIDWRGCVFLLSDKRPGESRRRAVPGKTRRPVRRGEPADNSMENRVEAPDRKRLANSPGTPKLGKSGFYSTIRLKWLISPIR